MGFGDDPSVSVGVGDAKVADAVAVAIPVVEEVGDAVSVCETSGDGEVASGVAV